MKLSGNKRFYVCVSGVVLGPEEDHIAARHLLEDLGAPGFVADSDLVIYSVKDMDVSIEELDARNEGIVNRVRWEALAG